MPPEVEQIVERVAVRLGVTPDDVMGRRRYKEHAWARQIAMWVLRERLQYSYPRIGRLFQRDHTTVMAAVRHVARAASLNLGLAEWLADEVARDRVALDYETRLAAP